MQLTVTVKLNTTPEIHTALLETMRVCNGACDRISQTGFESKTFRQFDLHALVYRNIKAETGLASNHVIRSIAKVSDAYKLDTNTLRTFQSTGAIELDKDLLTWKVQEQTVSINTLQSRLKQIPFLCSAEQKELLGQKRGQADLLLRDRQFYLAVAVNVPEAQVFPPCGVIGVDLGIVNVATDSEGHIYTGEPIKQVRRKYRRQRQLLAPHKTPSARKRRKKMTRKESRFVKDTNDCISKQLVHLATLRQKALAVEVLTGIRQRGNGFNRVMRTELNSWAFLQLKRFLTYKCQRSGVTLIEVDPRYSSQTCSRCGHCERANRKTQEGFCCVCCGLKLNADYNASLNLKARGELSAALMFRAEASASHLGQAVSVRGR